MNNLTSFDPLLFLGITNLKTEETPIVSQKLLDRISQYIAIRIIELLLDDDLKNIDDDLQKLFAVAKEKIPDLDKKAKVFLEDSRRSLITILNNYERGINARTRSSWQNTTMIPYTPSITIVDIASYVATRRTYSKRVHIQ